MNSRRELFLGLLAALVSLIIIGGSFITSLAEGKLSIAQLPQVINSTPIPTMVIFTPRPGEPTLTPSLVPSPTEELPACPVPAGWAAITINPGDTLESLAANYAVSVETLRENNCLLIDSLIPGTFLYAPALPASPTPTQRASATACVHPWGWVLYTVQRGDNLYSLATRVFMITVEQLKRANCKYSDDILEGEQIWVPFIPTSTSMPNSTPTSTPSFTPSVTPLIPTVTNTVIPTSTFTPTQTNTPTNTPTSTSTSTATTEPTQAPTFTPASSPYP
jgi:LysM repeat protein